MTPSTYFFSWSVFFSSLHEVGSTSAAAAVAVSASAAAVRRSIAVSFDAVVFIIVEILFLGVVFRPALQDGFAQRYMFLLFRRCGLDGFFFVSRPGRGFWGILVGTLVGTLVGGLFCGLGVMAAPRRYAACVAMGCACRADVAPVQDKPVVRHGKQVARDVLLELQFGLQGRAGPAREPLCAPRRGRHAYRPASPPCAR